MKSFFLAALLLAGAPAFAQETVLLPANDSKPASAAPEYSVRNNIVITGTAVSFAPGSATLLPASERALQTIKSYLTDKTYISQLRIEGHTACGKGDQALSEARAKTVADWLIAHGVDCKRLIAAGFGCTKPLTAEHAEKNERIEFVNAVLRGYRIGGMPADGGGKIVPLNCL